MTDKKKIMVVDDAESMIILTKIALDDPDWEIRTAMSGEECLKRISEEKPDLVLLDIMMPKMSGYEVCREIKSEKSTKYITIAYYTALSRADIENEIKKTGADDYVPKGLPLEELKQKVRLILTRI